MLTALLTGLIGGLLNTPHCLGMCGGFPIHLAKCTTKGGCVSRQALFILGKTFTYVFLGTLAAALGVVLLRDTSLAKAAPVLRLTAGAITIVFGLIMIGIKLPPIRALQSIAEAGLVRSVFGGLFSNPSPAAAFVLGIGVGFLPCPLPMGLLAVAALSHHISEGAAVMLGLGLGTAPGVIAVAILGVGLDRRFAKFGMRAAGLALVAIGLFTIVRVTGVLMAPAPCCCGGPGN